MYLTERDKAVVLAVGKFRQLSSQQIEALFFAGLASKTPLQRSLNRLIESRMLARLQHRIVGGANAGSGQYVYQLGSLGWRFCQLDGAGNQYYPHRAIDYHTLDIANLFIELVSLERAGKLVITSYETEPDNWLELGGYNLTPDFMRLA